LKALLLPVKRIENAKQRLAPFLAPAERQALMAAMTADLFAAAAAATAPERVFVVTADPAATATAERNGWTVLHETVQTSESASVDDASRRCEALGVTALLRLPLDLPLVTGADIDAVFATRLPPRGVLMVPSRDGTGTNAILRAPPTLFASQFGSGSYAKHQAAAASAGVPVVELRNPRIEMDVDDAEDLRALLVHAPIGGVTGAWLADNDIAARLGKLGPPAAVSLPGIPSHQSVTAIHSGKTGDAP
jgi:2-phospho-L-lactate guanylyltransferase